MMHGLVNVKCKQHFNIHLPSEESKSRLHCQRVNDYVYTSIIGLCIKYGMRRFEREDFKICLATLNRT